MVTDAERKVGPVSLEVEGGIGIDDLRRCIALPCY